MASFVPNAEALTALTAMGIEKHIAEQALFQTGNQSCDAAIAYVFDRKSSRRRQEEDGACKMVFVVNEGLHMSVGKIAAQVAHGCLGMYRLVTGSDWDEDDELESWEECGEKKVVLKAVNHIQLRELEKAAKAVNLPTYMVEDAGRTEIPSGSLTVLVVFGYEELVDTVTGDLSLLK